MKVLDFGLAKLTESPQVAQEESTRTTPPWTDEGTILGTASYMSPEQASGKPVDARSDIFSLGFIRYEMVTGQRAFQGDSKISILAAVLNKEPKPASEISRSLPHDLEKIITRCLAERTRNGVFRLMADLKVALEELKEESDSRCHWPGQRPARPARPDWVLAPRSCTWSCVSGVAVAWCWFFRERLAENQGSPHPNWSRLPAMRVLSDPPAFPRDGNQVAFSWNGKTQDKFRHLRRADWFSNASG